MNDINLIDETFDRNQAGNYHLSIQTSYSGLSFCLLDTVSKKYVALRHYHCKVSQNLDYILNFIKDKFNSDDLLRLPYKHASHLFVDNKNTLVPISYFDESHEDAYFLFNHHSDADIKIMSASLPHAVAANIFSYPTGLYNLMEEIYPSIQLVHHSSVFIENLVFDSMKWSQSKCYISINQNFIDIGIARSKRLEFYNTFSFKNNSDLIYYILSVLDQFKLSPLFTEVFMASSADKHDEMFDFLNNYLHVIKFIRPTDKYTYSYVFDELQLTRFFNLFNLALCE